MVWTVFYEVNHSGNAYPYVVVAKEEEAQELVDDRIAEGEGGGDYYCSWFYKEGDHTK